MLGPKDTRPGAPDYPVSLGFALLEDLRGNIALDLPISGRLDDAALQVGGLVGKALGGLFTKVVTSPFALLGGIIGLVTPGDPALQVIAFPPGDTRINPAAQGRLKRIAKALEERPRVKIELIGMYEPAKRHARPETPAGPPQGAGPAVRRPARQTAGNQPRWHHKVVIRRVRTLPAARLQGLPRRRKAKGNEEPDIMERSCKRSKP